MKKAIYYHEGSPAGVSGEQTIVALLDDTNCEVEIINLNEEPMRIEEARQAGVQSVPALVSEGHVLHLSGGKALRDLQRAQEQAESALDEPSEATSDLDLAAAPCRAMDCDYY